MRLAEVVMLLLGLSAIELLEAVRTTVSEVFNTLGCNMWDLKAVEAKRVEIVAAWLITSTDASLSPMVADLARRLAKAAPPADLRIAD